MKLGISSAPRHSSPKEWAQLLYKLGCRSVVFPVNCHAPQEVQQAYYEAAKEQQLVIAEVGVWNNVLAKDTEERKRAMEYAINQLALADRIEADCCVNIAGTPVGTRWDGGYQENFIRETWDMTVETVQEIIDSVRPRFTKFSLESMPWMIPTGPEEYLQLIEDINRPQFGVHLDFINMINCPQRYFFNDEFMKKCFLLLRGRILSCHLKDIRLKDEFTFQLEETACGKGILNLELLRDLIDAENPDMPVLIEHLTTDEEYLDSLRYIQKRLG